jgi:hypothetical protein
VSVIKGLPSDPGVRVLSKRVVPEDGYVIPHIFKRWQARFCLLELRWVGASAMPVKRDKASTFYQ